MPTPSVDKIYYEDETVRITRSHLTIESTVFPLGSLASFGQRAIPRPWWPFVLTIMAGLGTITAGFAMADQEDKGNAITTLIVGGILAIAGVAGFLLPPKREFVVESAGGFTVTTPSKSAHLIAEHLEDAVDDLYWSH